jgi:hypothetical protein
MATHTEASASTPAADHDTLHCFTDTESIITSTMNDLPCYRITRTLDTIYGLSVRSRNLGANLASVMGPWPAASSST